MINNQRGLTLIANSVHNTSRLFKIAKFLTENGRISELNIIGFWSDGLPLYEQFSPKIIIERVKTLKQKLPNSNVKFISKLLTLISIVPFFAQIFFTCLRKKPEVIYCHDVVLLPIALMVKLFSKCIIIYMPHELETEETGRSNLMNSGLKIIETFCMNFVESTTVVSPDIQKWYKNEYNTEKVYLIRNIPDFNIFQHSYKKTLRARIGLSDNDIVFIYQGLIEISRGVIELANVFSIIQNTNKHLVFMGYGPASSEILGYVSSCPNIHFIPAVEPSEIFNYTSDADVGLFFIAQEISKSYRYSLPNKYFEYIKSGIPVLVSDNLVSITQEIVEKKTGWSINSNIDKLKSFVESVNISDIQEAKQKVLIASEEYSWSKDVEVISKF